MSGFTKIVAVSIALVAETTAIIQAAASPDPNSVIMAGRNDSLVLGESAPTITQGSGRAGSALVTFAGLAATLAMMYLVFLCVNALKSNKNWNRYSLNKRRLSERASGSCGVGPSLENLGPCLAKGWIKALKRHELARFGQVKISNFEWNTGTFP